MKTDEKRLFNTMANISDANQLLKKAFLSLTLIKVNTEQNLTDIIGGVLNDLDTVYNALNNEINP